MTIPPRVFLPLLLVAAVALSSAAQADDDHRLTFFPDGDPYPQYLADPFRAGMSLQRVWLGDTDLPSSGDVRFHLRLGGRFGLVKIHPPGEPEKGWQISLDAGFFGTFDSEDSNDNLGWDGYYGLVATTELRDDLSLKIGALHTSSHVGDEFAEETGRRRIGYTREELVAGLYHRLGPRWRVYGDLAWAYKNNADEQEPLRLQAGTEYVAEGVLGRGFGWFSALDVQSWEENDWDASITAQVGLLLHRGGRWWRVALEAYDGRNQVGEFFFRQDSYVALGLYLDFF